MKYVAAVIQLTSSSDEEANLAAAETFVREAADRGASFVATPENTNFLGPQDEKVRRAQPLDGPVCRRFADLARELRIHLLLGSFNEACDDPDRCFSTSVLFDPEGAIRGAYRKMHLFDVDVSPEVRFVESDAVRPGREVVVARTDLGAAGLTICFDLRFSWLYRELRSRGAELITIPSAFTRVTGRDHWHTLVRARAIETQCWVLAPAQVGRHDDRGIRESFGHALIVDPWGEIVADAGERPGLAVAEIDLERVREVRRAMPMRGGPPSGR